MVVPVLQGLPGSGCVGMTTANFGLLLEQGLAPFLPAMLQGSPSTSSSQDVDQTQVEGQGSPIPQPETTSLMELDSGIDFMSWLELDETAVGLTS